MSYPSLSIPKQSTRLAAEKAADPQCVQGAWDPAKEGQQEVDEEVAVAALVGEVHTLPIRQESGGRSIWT